MARNNDNMLAANWKALDLSKIDKIQSSSNKHKQLFNDIKELIKNAINCIYGTAQTEDKYVKIVNLIMLRIQGALETLNIDNELIIENIQKTISDCLAKYDISNKNTNTESNKNKSESTEDDSTKNIDTKTIIKDLTDSIQNSIQENIQQNNKESNNKKTEKTTTNKSKSSNTDISRSINKILTNVDENLKKLEKTIISNFNIFKNPKILNSKQFKTLKNIVIKQYQNLCKLVSNTLNTINTNINNIVDLQLKTYKIVEDYINSTKKWNLVTILLYAGIILTVIFTALNNKVQKWIKAKLGIDEKENLFAGLCKKLYQFINKLIAEIDFKKIIKVFVNKIIDALKSTLNDMIGNPIKTIWNLLEKKFLEIVEFKNKIWDLITGGESKAKKEQEKIIDNSIKQVEKNTQEQIDSANKKQESSFNQIKQDIDAATIKQTEQVDSMVDENIKQTISAQNQIEKTTDEAITTTSKNISEIKDKTIPNTSQEITQTTNNNINNLQNNIQKNITDSTKQLAENAKDITKEIAKDGAQKPAKVDKLNSLQSSTGGVKIEAQNGNVKIPDGVTQIPSPDGKVVYTSTEKAKEANEKIADINNTTNNLGIKPQVNVDSSVNNNVQQNIQISAEKYPSNIKLKNQTIKEYEQLIENVNKLKTDIKSNKSLLSDIKTDVNKYFSELNTSMKLYINSKQQNNTRNSEQQNNTIIITNSKKDINRFDAEKENRYDFFNNNFDFF